MNRHRPLRPWISLLCAMLLSACSAPTATPFAATPTPVARPTVVHEPKPTPTAGRIYPPLLAGERYSFTEGEKAGRIDFDKMYPIVGEVNHANRHYWDFRFGTLNVMYWDERDLSTIENQVREMRIVDAQLDADTDFKDILFQVQEAIKKQISIALNYRDFTVVVDAQGKISQVIDYRRTNLDRYLFANGELRQVTKEEEPLLMPLLSSPDHRFIRTDTGEQVMLRGGHIVNTVFAPSKVDVAQIDGILQGLSNIGANWVVFQWNSGFFDGAESSVVSL